MVCTVCKRNRKFSAQMIGLTEKLTHIKYELTGARYSIFQLCTFSYKNEDNLYKLFMTFLM